MDTIQEEGLEQDVLDSLALADTAIQREDLASIALFEGLRTRRIRDNIGSGDLHEEMKFDDFFTTPATTANEITLEARIRLVDGIEYIVPQATLTLPAASGVDTLVSNQTLIMFESTMVDVTVGGSFYLGSNGDSVPISWVTLTPEQQQAYGEDLSNNLYVEAGVTKQWVFSYVVTNLTQDYAKGDPQAIIDAGYTQGTVGDHFVRWTKTDIVAESIAQVQRRNQGAYEPAINPNGTAEFGDSLPWYSTTDDRATVANCFTTVGDGSISGAASGRGDGKFFDTIEASDIHDLRMSSRRVPRAELREQYKRKAIAGTVRGYEGVPFQLNATTSNANSHSQANPTWTTVIATDTVFNTTFASGVEGVLSATKPDGIKDTFPLGRKLLTTLGAERSTDNGANWVSFTPSVNTTTNTVTLTNEPVANIVLVHFETQAHFTEDDANSAVIDLGGSHMSGHNELHAGSILCSSLIGKVRTSTGGGMTLESSVRNYTIQGNTGTLKSDQPAISEGMIGTPTNSSPAIKTLDYMSLENGVGKLCYVYKEMVYDSAKSSWTGTKSVAGVTNSISAGDIVMMSGYTNSDLNGRLLQFASNNSSNWSSTTFDGYAVIDGIVYTSSGALYPNQLWDGNGWGDNDQFEISDNQVADTDDNGNDILRGTASFGIPFYLTESI